LKPPQSTLFCVLSLGDVLDSRRARCGEDVASARQMSPITGKLTGV
ncbi:hypothetical protein A2U01_0046131, partial [Trifolium medium]|nr:hypothetical protein [Trifolium medium]